MTFLRTISLVLASTIVFASAASADFSSRDGARDGFRGNRGDRPVTAPGRPAVLPTVRPQSPVVIVRPVAPPAVVHEGRGPRFGYWGRDRYRDFRGYDRRHGDFRGHYPDRRWYRWW